MTMILQKSETTRIQMEKNNMNKNEKKYQHPNKGAIILSSRDYEIFKLLFRYNISTLEQISKYIFNTTKTRHPRRRLNLLIKNGFIIRGCHIRVPGNFFYYLSKKGYRIVHPKEIEKKSLNLKTMYPFHDFMLLEIGQILKKSNVIQNFYTESEYRLEQNLFTKNDFQLSSQSLNPDILITLTHKDKLIKGSLELELSDKGTKRYYDLLRKYYKNKEFNFVFYLYPRSSPIVKKIKDLEIQIDEKKFGKFFYIEYETFLDQKKPIIMSNILGEEFELK